MSIEIHDAALEERIQQQMRRTGAGSIEELLRSLLENKEEQDRWLVQDRAANEVKIRRGIEELDRSEGIPQDRLVEYLERLKSQPE